MPAHLSLTHCFLQQIQLFLPKPAMKAHSCACRISIKGLNLAPGSGREISGRAETLLKLQILGQTLGSELVCLTAIKHEHKTLQSLQGRNYRCLAASSPYPCV